MSTNSNVYHGCLAYYFSSQPNFFDGDLQKKPHIRKCMELPFQQTNARLWEEVIVTICNLDFIQAKTCAKMTYDLVKDYNVVLQVIPDNAENILEENERQARMEKYIMDLIAYAKGEIHELEIPETKPFWSEERINAEIGRMKANPSRLDRLNDFMNFLSREASNLQNYSHEIPNFVTQQAWNNEDSGPVGKSAENTSQFFLKNLMLRSTPNRLVWNTLSQTIYILKGHTDYVSAVAITPDSKWAISSSWDKTCILWDLKTGQAIQVLKGHNEIVHAVAITPDGTKAISGSGRPSMSESTSSAENDCIVWDLNTGQSINTLKGHKREVVSVAITPDGKSAISCAKDKTCIVWDLLTGHLVNTLKGNDSSVTSIDITPDGTLAISGSMNNTCIIWDINSGQTIKKLTGHTRPVRAVAITPDGSVAISGSEDKTCILWDIKTGDPLFILKGHTDYVSAVSITPDGKRAVSGSSDSTCIIWDLISGKEINRLRGHANEIHAVAISANGNNAISGSNDKYCIFWDLNIREVIDARKGHTDKVFAIDTFPGSKMAISASRDKSCIVWDIGTGLVTKSLKGHTYSVHSVAVTPDSNRAISGSWKPIIGSWGKTCIIWDLKTDQEIYSMNEHEENVNAVDITPDGKKAVSASSDKTCIIWDMITGQPINKLIGHTLDVNAVAITPDGMRVVSASSAFNDGTIGKTFIIWDINSGQAIKELEGYPGAKALAITPDGRNAVSDSGQGNCILWDLSSGCATKTLKMHTADITDIVISPDGKNVISRSVDNTCIIWDLESQKRLGLFVTAPNTYAMSYFEGGVIGGDSAGNIFIINLRKELFCRQRCILTIKRIWDFELNRYLPLSADCPLCGHRFSPSTSVLATIESITKNTGLRPDQSPCLELPDEAWEDPELLGNCPKCGEKLKFNPFIAGVEN
jgi:WD40 repeat protein